MKKVLLIDDEIEMLIGIEKILSKKSKFEIFKEINPLKAIELIKNKKYDLIITDLKMEPASGMEILQAVKNYSSGSKVIMISGYGTIEAGVKAAKEGAFDFIEKPFTSKRLLEAIQAAENNDKDEKTDTKILFEDSVTEKYGIVYKSKEMAEVVELIEKFSDGDMNILLTGETGVGKEILARALHHLSPNRAGNSFIAVNCASIPTELAESELFGANVLPNMFRQNTDGEIFWKISNGHIASGMPPYGSSLSDDDRWKIVSYLRTLYPDYQPPANAGAAPAGPPAEKFTGTINSITLSLAADKQKLTAKLDAVDEEGNPAYAKNVKVNIYVKRQFGSLLLGTVKTNDKGEAIVDCPADIPADTSGDITISAVTADSSAYMSMKVAYGEKLNWKNPLDENHMWGTSAKAPVWIKTTYLSVVILVWLVIFWAAFQLVRIYSLRER